MAILIVFFLLYNIRMKNEYEVKIKKLEERVSKLDVNLKAAQDEVIFFLENSNLVETLEVFNSSQGSLIEIVKKIEELSVNLGEEE